MNSAMHARRHLPDPWSTALRLALALSVASALLVLLLGPDVSQTGAVLTVVVVGFVASWVLTGREAGGAAAPATTRAGRCDRHVSATTPVGERHRVVVVPVRRAVG
jgi:hypothetical protein